MRRIASRVCLAMWGAMAVGAGPAARADGPTLREMVTTGVTDLTATVKVAKTSSAELEKINRDYALAYSLRDVVMRFREPGKLRVESKIGVLVYSGKQRFFQVRALGIRQKDEQGEAPGQRHSLLDVGLLSASAETVLQGAHVRDEDVDGEPSSVFDVAYRGDTSARYRLWFARKTRVVLRREWYDPTGKLRARFVYGDIREVAPGVWTPTRVEIQNRDGKTAAVASYTSVAVNQGIDDALFVIP